MMQIMPKVPISVSVKNSQSPSRITAHTTYGVPSMPETVNLTTMSAPPSVLAGSQLSASEAVRRKLHKSEALLKAAKVESSLDDVAGMLAPRFEDRRIAWRAAATSAREVWGTGR
jgi:hypothetical protein